MYSSTLALSVKCGTHGDVPSAVEIQRRLE
jgi:hypothetical protein